MVSGQSPTEEPVLYFTPTKKFKWEKPIEEDGITIHQLMGIYKPGLRYTVRKGNTDLLAQVEQWRKDGSVRVQEF